MKTATMKLRDIKPAAYNPRVALKEGDKEWESLKRSLQRFGVATPLIVNEVTGNLISGHQRLSVLKAEGVEETEVVILNIQPDREKLLNVAMNKIEGDWDYEKLEDLLKEFTDVDIAFTGFTVDELEGLFSESFNSYGDEIDAQDEPDEDDAGDGHSKKSKESGANEPGFTLYLSFATKEFAESWLKEHGYERAFGSSRSITIRMEATDHGA